MATGIKDKVAGRYVGCMDLWQEVSSRIKPRIHVFGHVHTDVNHGVTRHFGSTFVNASICNEEYRAVRKPVVMIENHLLEGWWITGSEGAVNGQKEERGQA